jgi:DNA-directed RNA polymerase subunit E'/Rpb7
MAGRSYKMLYTYVLATIIGINPPQFAFIDEFDTMEGCQEAIKKDVEEKFQEEFGCLVIVKPENFKEGT